MKFSAVLFAGQAAAACSPTLVLDSAAVPLVIKPSCGTLDTTRHAVFAFDHQSSHSLGDIVENTTISADAITLPKGIGANQIVTVAAFDSTGKQLLQSFNIATLQSSPNVERDSWSLVSRAAETPATSTCTACHPDVMCKTECQKPDRDCGFYASCAEAAWHCGPNGYPIGYGLKNCQKFMNRLDQFTTDGQAWIFRVLTCLQKFLVGPLSSCDSTCDSIKTQAFDSHPVCYVDSGVCSLGLWDNVQLVITINTDLIGAAALKQVFITGTKCGQRFLNMVVDEIKKLKGLLGSGNDIATLGKITVLEAAKKFLESL
ncbi:hypothetical protein VHEMI09202 [[Torrubiella] hemipterigena]|uniref:Uncharacterized protein n=1 Tax=[Torrubiella] hemipterigena TaxID=1531966 RepID=A0A0A1TFS4_9HYPO|nr:hypothetical protein VHEMI09202 [[Torrubiella] hemipterigena]